jgi:hypothetical protein
MMGVENLAAMMFDAKHSRQLVNIASVGHSAIFVTVEIQNRSP